MSEELGLIELIFGASAVVQGVMLILVLASLSSWFLIIQRVMLMRRADEALLSFEESFWSGIDLAQLYREGNQAVADGELPTGAESLCSRYSTWRGPGQKVISFALYGKAVID